MEFNRHYELRDRHAFLSPSQYAWIRYTDEHLEERFIKSVAARKGTELHQLAHDMIKHKIQAVRNKKSFNMYVNDAIGFRMTPEQPLYYSENCFGTADALSFRKNLLKISDLKTGDSKASVDQLLVYSALFCLEYKFKPFDIEYDLRIYQSDEIQTFIVDPGDVAHIMDRIITFDKYLTQWKSEEL